jgi:hypothetical protein
MEEEIERLELMRLSNGRLLLMTGEHGAAKGMVTGITLTARQAKELARALDDGCEIVLENKEEE